MAINLNRKQSTGTVVEKRDFSGSPSGYIDFQKMLPKNASEYPHRQNFKNYLVSPRTMPPENKPRASFKIK
jgi:hypothetical protein